ncbi:MAG: NAD-dependent succinate-semialdehyde dehydrogenase [Cyclobacteriaceae bacterium]|nr:NAD-dependent succinate-semialdehyde dehydrogenase [Cyclobacteriaceae bacterium]
MLYNTINPSNGNPIRSYSFINNNELIEKINFAFEAYTKWREVSFAEKTNLFRQLIVELKERTNDLAGLMAQEMGKPLHEGIAEINKCIFLCEYYIENGSKFLTPEEVKTEATKSYVSFEPMGVIFGIMPWNFPFWQVFRFAVPTIIGGNTVLLKHAPNVFGCAETIQELFTKAGFPNGIFNNLIIDIDQVEEVIANNHVKAVSLTGSGRAGKSVAALAGKYLKKSVLELGGSDPYLILRDADLNIAVNVCAQSRLINNGQTCISAKRFIVHNSIKKEFEKMLVEKMKTYKIGSPEIDGVQLGPMAREDLLLNLDRQVKESIGMGAVRLLGEGRLSGSGYFYSPTILTNVNADMPVWQEETFGPVAAVIGFEKEEEGIMMANDTIYGLGAAVISNDLKKAEDIAREKLQAGSCFVNTFVKSDPRLPFGGINQSGYGRELSHFGMREFLNIKTVYIH